jgi:hypothetical protein
MEDISIVCVRDEVGFANNDEEAEADGDAEGDNKGGDILLDECDEDGDDDETIDGNVNDCEVDDVLLCALSSSLPID